MGFSTATYLAIASAAIGAYGVYQQGQAQETAGKAAAGAAAHQAQLAEREAAALEISAGQERAAAQRNMLAERRRAGLVSSRARAVASASGGALDSPDLINTLADIESEGDFQADTALYSGEERGRQLEHAAMVKRAGGVADLYAGEVARRSGAAARSRSYLAAGGSLLAGAARAYDYEYGSPRARRLLPGDVGSIQE
jgi:hypothetical protein